MSAQSDMAHLSELRQTQRPHDSKSPSSKVLLGALASNGYGQYQFHPSTSLFHCSAFSCVQEVYQYGRYFRVFMHTLIGPDDGQTQWLPIPFVAIALGANSLVGCCLCDSHRGILISLYSRADARRWTKKVQLQASFGPLNAGSASPDSPPDFQ